MSEAVKVITSVMVTAAVIFMFGWVVFVMYWILKYTGMIKHLAPLTKLINKWRKVKPIPEETYEKIIKHIEEGKELGELEEMFKDKTAQEQEVYIRAYREIRAEMKEREMKGGNDVKDGK